MLLFEREGSKKKKLQKRNKWEINGE